MQQVMLKQLSTSDSPIVGAYVTRSLYSESCCRYLPTAVLLHLSHTSYSEWILIIISKPREAEEERFAFSQASFQAEMNQTLKSRDLLTPPFPHASTQTTAAGTRSAAGSNSHAATQGWKRTAASHVLLP